VGSLKQYLLYFPLVSVGFQIGLRGEPVMPAIRKLEWIVVPVFLVTVFQLLTGWGTADVADDVVGQGGTSIRQSYGEGGTIVTLSSTMYGGRLGPVSAIWTIAILTVLLYHSAASKRVRLQWAVLSMCIFNLIAGTNNTALLSTITAVSMLSVFALWDARGTAKWARAVGLLLLGGGGLWIAATWVLGSNGRSF